MNGVTFGEYHSYDDFSLILTSKEIAAPKIKTVEIDIPGADGTLDLTEFFGEPKYENVKLIFQFSTIVPQNNFLTQFSTVKNAIHGKKLRISLDADLGFFYVGRCYVSSFTNEKNIGKISVECECEPYKYKAQRTKQIVPFYGKNIFNPANTRQGVLNAGIGLTFAALTAYTTTTRLRSISPFYIKSNTQYTFSFPNATFKAAVRQFDKDNILVASSAWVTSPYTFGTLDKTEKLALYIAFSGDGTITPEDISNEQFQLEEGNAATAFEAYDLTEKTLSAFLANSKKSVVPDIYSYDEVTITNGEETFVIKDGETKTFPEFELKEGSNQFNITGTGVVVFEWQEGGIVMYKVYADGKLIHNDQWSVKITNAKLILELGKSGLFEFMIYPEHPRYAEVKPLKTIIEVQRHEKAIFRGRVLDLKYGFYNEKQVTCEGELAFLLDSIVPPHAVSDSFSAYLDYIVGIHNAQVETEKRFTVGSVTVADFAPFEVVEDFNFLSSFETINKRMVEPTGGILQVRHESGTMFLDLLSPSMNINNVSAQKIRLGKNLLDIKRDTKGGEVFSGIIPLGAKLTDSENRLDISGVNGGSYSVSNATAVAAYGKIFKVVIFENITNASMLLSEARTYLAENFAAVNSIEITAADLSGINPALDSFEIGQWVQLVSDKHFTAPQTFLVRKMTVNLSRPAETKIEVGRTQQGLLESLGYTSENVRDVAGRLGRLAQSVRDMASKLGGAATKAEAAAEAATNAITQAETAQTTAENVSTRVTKLESVQPYVIASGTTGIWTWKKFSDGTAECFGKIDVTGVAVEGTLGGWYRSETLYDAAAYPYPVTFLEAPATEMMFQTRSGSAALLWAFSGNANNAKLYVPQVYIIRPVTAASVNGNINIIAKGKV